MYVIFLAQSKKVSFYFITLSLRSPILCFWFLGKIIDLLVFYFYWRWLFFVKIFDPIHKIQFLLELLNLFKTKKNFISFFEHCEHASHKMHLNKTRKKKEKKNFRHQKSKKSSQLSNSCTADIFLLLVDFALGTKKTFFAFDTFFDYFSYYKLYDNFNYNNFTIPVLSG